MVRANPDSLLSILINTGHNVVILTGRFTGGPPNLPKGSREPVQLEETRGKSHPQCSVAIFAKGINMLVLERMVDVVREPSLYEKADSAAGSNPDSTLLADGQSAHFVMAKTFSGGKRNKPPRPSHQQPAFGANPQISFAIFRQGLARFAPKCPSVRSIVSREAHPIKAGQSASGSHPKVAVPRLEKALDPVLRKPLLGFPRGDLKLGCVRIQSRR